MIPDTASFSMATTFRYVRGFLDQDLHTGFLDQHPFDFLGSIQVVPGQMVKDQEETSSHFISHPSSEATTIQANHDSPRARSQSGLHGSTTWTNHEKTKLTRPRLFLPETKTALEDRSFVHQPLYTCTLGVNVSAQITAPVLHQRLS